MKKFERSNKKLDNKEAQVLLRDSYNFIVTYRRNFEKKANMVIKMARREYASKTRKKMKAQNEKTIRIPWDAPEVFVVESYAVMAECKNEIEDMEDAVNTFNYVLAYLKTRGWITSEKEIELENIVFEEIYSKNCRRYPLVQELLEAVA